MNMERAYDNSKPDRGKSKAAADAPPKGRVYQGKFIAPHPSELAMARAYVADQFPTKLDDFDATERDERQQVYLYDWLIETTRTNMHDVYDWHDRQAVDTHEPDFAELLAQFNESAAEKPGGSSRKTAMEDIDEKKERAGAGVKKAHVEDTPGSAAATAMVDEERPDPELARLSMVQLLRKAFEECGVAKKLQKNAALYNLLLDIGAADLKSMPLDSKVIKLPEYYKNWLLYTSCNNSAVKLAARMSGISPDEGPYVGKPAAEAKNEKSADWMTSAMELLFLSLRADLGGNKRSIYEVHAGGHGFAIIVRGGGAEILQSFANYVALVERMERGALSLDSGTLLKTIQQLADSSEKERDIAAQLIANCDAAMFGLKPYPSYEFKWRARVLLSDKQILEFFKADLAAAYKEVKGILSL